ncbi:Protein_disulfide isomerase PDI2 [Hexamita inflata]|uniref:Protein disulfide isomerase PDI2 n=1 Tax=Hexamita inflata TaxID=28002 RepID=A0AA86QCH2_9EUKA|nr:Protein disulfide isomerase PDI2 [Hexamita inflata]
MISFVIAFSEVLSLTNVTFDAHPKKFVKFFAPWCGHCQALAPVWEEIATEYKGVEFVEVNCDDNSELCGKYGVSGFPTLKFFDGEQVIDYNGARTKDAIVLFADAITKPQFEFVEESVCHNSGDKNYFVVYTDDIANLVNLAQFKGKVKFCTVRGQSTFLLAFNYGVKTEYDGDFSADSLRVFVDKYQFGPVPEYTQDNAQVLVNKNLTLIVIDPEQHQSVLDNLRAGEFKHSQDYNIVWFNGVQNIGMLDVFKVKQNQFPHVIVFDVKTFTQFYKRELVAEKAIDIVNGFIDEIINGKVEANKIKQQEEHEQGHKDEL